MEHSPLKDAGRHFQQLLLDEILPVVFRVVIALVVFVIIVFVAGVLLHKYRYRNNPAAGVVHAKRDRLGEEFGLKIDRVRPDGRIQIAPGESSLWMRAGLEDELKNFLGEKISLAVKNGFAWIKTPFELPESVDGDPVYANGDVYLGVGLEDGVPAFVDMREVSTVLVGGRPGSGKSVLLENLIDAFGDQCMVHHFDGKLTEPSHAMDTLVGIQEIMEERLRLGVDWWRDSQHYSLVVFVVDECQRLFAPDSSVKADKEAAAERTRVVRDIAQRGRSAGVLLILASQRLSADVVPTGIRDLAGVRFVGRCTRAEDVEMILGRRTDQGEPDPTTFRRGQFLAEGASGVSVGMQVYAR